MDFDALFERFYPSVYRYSRRLTGDPDVAEDAAQEAFVRMLRARPEGEPEALRGWLFRVAVNCIRDRARVRSNRERLLEENPGEAPAPDPEEPPDRRVERLETVAAVREALDVLDPRDREILLLREEGLAYREIAAAVGVAASSVGTLLARARRSFEEVYLAMQESDDASG